MTSRKQPSHRLGTSGETPEFLGELEKKSPFSAKAGKSVSYSKECLWGLTWYALGTPTEWLSTSHSMFGSAMMALGLGLVYRSTDIKRDVVRPVNWWVIVGLLVAVSIAAFFLGTKWQETQQAALAVQIVEARNECPDETPIAGNQGGSGKIYHMPDGPYYAQTNPEACFPNEEAARLAGYRPVHR